MFGHLSNKNAIITPNVLLLPNPGDYLLFALGENPDGTYGSGPEGLLNVDGEKVVHIDGVPFATETSPEQLIQDIRDAALTRVLKAELAAPDPLSLPEAAVPMDLGDVKLPEDADSIVSLFNRLPRELAGGERTPRLDETGPSRLTAAYGQLPKDGCSSVRLQVEGLSSGEFFPADWTADRLVAWWGLGADRDLEDLGRYGDLSWVRWDTTCRSAPSTQSYPVSTLTWGKAGSRWVFSIVAGSSEDLAELAAAFVVAAE